MKKIITIILFITMALYLTACAGKVEMADIKGSWTASKLNGQTIAEFADAKGFTEDMVAVNVLVTDAQYITTNVSTSGSYYIIPNDRGFDVLYPGSTKVMMTVVYNSFSDTLSYKVSGNGMSFEYELVRGTYKFTSQ